MLDYTNNGASDPTGYQRLTFAGRGILLGATEYSLAVWLRRTRSTGINNMIVGERNTTTGNLKGWLLGCDGSFYLWMQHGDGVSYADVSPSSTLTVNTLYLWVFTWDGSTYQWWRDNGVNAGSGSFTKTIAATPADLTLGGDDGGATQAFAGQASQVLIWPGRKLVQADAQTLYAGTTIPYAEEVKFFHRGTAIPGFDEYESETPIQTGTIWLKALDPPDNYYPNGIPAPFATISGWREALSRDLRRRRFPEETYTIGVPLEYLSLELLDDLNVSHDSLPRAASLLASIEDDHMMKRWQRMYSICVAQSIDLNAMTMDLTFTNAEPYIAYAWSTDMLPGGWSDDYDGLAQMDQGCNWQNERASLKWMEQEDDRIAALGFNQVALNHVGFLAVDAVTNDVKNSRFDYDSGFTSWTTVLNGGNINPINDRPFIGNDESGDTYYYCAVMINGGSNETYAKQDISVLAADANRRVSIYHRELWEPDTPGVCGWQLQRSSDSWYWNDSTPAWQSGAVWNNFSQVYPWTREHSELITCTSTETWTLSVGETTGTSGNKTRVGQVDCTKGKYYYPPIATPLAATYSLVADKRYLDLDLGTNDDYRLTYPSRCGTFRCTFTAYQNGGYLADGDEMAIAYAQYDTSEDNYDAILYQKLSGQNVRFALERYRNGSMEARAYKDTTIVKDTSYEIAGRWTFDEFGTTPTNNARDLDGSSDYYARASDLLGNVDGKKGILAARVRLDGGNGTLLKIMSSEGAYIALQRMTTNKFQVYGKDSGGTERLNLQTNSTYTSSTAVLNILASWDLSAGDTHFYVNDKDENNEVTADDANIDYTRSSGYGVGSDHSGANKFNGAISSLYCNFADSIDFSVEANRRLFFRSDGTPEYIGGDGSVPTGNDPIIYLPSGNGENNCGSGGQFTENGSPSAVGLAGPHRTLSIFVDGVKGTDAQAESNQPDFERVELIPDPTCATDFFDSKGTGWSHDSTDDEYDCSGAQSGDSDLTEGSVCVNGFVYRVEYEVKNYAAGKIVAVCGTQEGSDQAGDGVYVEYITANGTDFKIRGDADFEGSVTNIYVCRDRYTGLWIGSAPSGVGHMTAMNYISNWEVIPRAIPDEEIQARR